MLLEDVGDGIAGECSAKIADAISDEVSVDVLEAAGHKEWNPRDIRPGVGRVALNRFGAEV